MGRRREGHGETERDMEWQREETENSTKGGHKRERKVCKDKGSAKRKERQREKGKTRERLRDREREKDKRVSEIKGGKAKE